MPRAIAGIDYCEHCSVYPRNPCRSNEEVSDCPNANEYTREAARSSLPGYSREEAEELAEYRRRYGRL